MSLFPSIFVPLPSVSPLYGECVVRFSLPGGVFLPCNHGLNFGIISAHYAIIQSMQSIEQNQPYIYKYKSTVHTVKTNSQFSGVTKYCKSSLQDYNPTRLMPNHLNITIDNSGLDAVRFFFQHH